MTSAALPGYDLIVDTERYRVAITNGLGRAVLVLNEESWLPHEAAIVHACLHNTAYDPQCEGDRADYMYEVIGRTGAQEHFAGIISDGLLAVKKFWDADHLFELTGRFASDSNGRARDALYEKFRRDDVEEHFVGAHPIITLEGINGLLFVVDFIGQKLITEPGLGPDNDLLLSHATEVTGQDATAILEEKARTNPNLRRYLDALASSKTLQENSKRSEPFHQLPYAQVREQIERGGATVPRNALMGWGRRASTDAIAQAAADLLQAEDEAAQIAYARMFSRREFPLAPDKLLRMAQSSNDDLASAAISALEHLQDPRIRTLALELMEKRRRIHGTLALLARNYLPGDHVLIESQLATDCDEDEYHSLAGGALDVFCAQPVQEALGSLLMLYERIRCSICRLSAVKILAKQGIMPDWMAAECLHDSDKETRGLSE